MHTFSNDYGIPNPKDVDEIINSLTKGTELESLSKKADKDLLKKRVSQ
jgi:hypothetical protein